MLKISYYVVLMILELTRNILQIYGISFVTKPENKTFLHGQMVLYFNCSTDSFSDSGIDWVFTSFSSPDSERHIVKWRHEHGYAVLPGFTVEQPNNLTNNLLIWNPSSSLSGKYCCQCKYGHGEKSCAYAKEINLPQNEVVLAGRGVMLNCAHVKAFRWYRYLQTDPLDDKVIYMGSRMADDVDERFRVYTEPDHYPYDRLDLYMSNVQTDLFGTYKCQQSRMAHCAEVIVLDSEPVCDVRLARRFGIIAEAAKLKCRIKITKNTVPEMLCSENTTGYQTEHMCSKRHHGAVTCTTEVALEKLPNIACTIKFHPKPLQKYATCVHVANQPSYSFVWKPPSDELLLFNSTQLTLIAALAASVVIYILTWTIVLVIHRRKRQKRHTKDDLTSTASIETCSTESECLSKDSAEKHGIPDSAMVVTMYSQNTLCQATS